ncbi:hypothetical protein Ddc_18744 [Ditylenchus destructor]|nr:hypothetical protein Ddc_18744 [Ditylenchus destructor]
MFDWKKERNICLKADSRTTKLWAFICVRSLTFVGGLSQTVTGTILKREATWKTCPIVIAVFGGRGVTFWNFFNDVLSAFRDD